MCVCIGADDDNWKLADAVRQMNQKREGRFVGPVKIFEDPYLRTGSSRTGQRFRNALEQIAAPLRRRQIQWLRYIWKDAAQAWRDLGQFGRVIPHMPAEIFEAPRFVPRCF